LVAQNVVANGVLWEIGMSDSDSRVLLAEREGQQAPSPVYETSLGACYVGDALDLLHWLPDESVNLVLTSPPFALTRKKEYGNRDADQYVDWLLQFVPGIRRVLRQDGSFVLDIGNAFLPGSPVRTVCPYELVVRICKEQSLFLAQEFFHYNPASLPAPAEWVNVRRIRVKDAVNLVWWFSKTPDPKADNRNVLRPYSKSMKKLLKKGYRSKLRPSGHDISGNFSKRNEGAIPPNLIEAPNTASNTKYLRRCRSAGYKPHPARFPPQFPEFFIKFLTTSGDSVLDIFAGSNTTGYVAEQLGRRWVAFERREDYAEASRLRFEPETSLFPPP
jgi:site-specific DNA-methyltransferase (cytosine-N4-specific)